MAAAQRMTANTVANIRVADKSGLIPFEKDGWMVWIERNGNRAFVSSLSGPIVYKGQVDARRAIRRLRPDLVEMLLVTI